MFIQASVSVKRLGSYLKGEELDPNAVQWESESARGKLTWLCNGGGSFGSNM